MNGNTHFTGGDGAGEGVRVGLLLLTAVWEARPQRGRPGACLHVTPVAGSAGVLGAPSPWKDARRLPGKG